VAEATPLAAKLSLTAFPDEAGGLTHDEIALPELEKGKSCAISTGQSLSRTSVSWKPKDANWHQC
jgi:hypothetical protein